ncbi:MAG: hypothetical protein ACYDC6_08400 [Acidobacteriaceae bacterium]
MQQDQAAGPGCIDVLPIRCGEKEKQYLAGISRAMLRERENAALYGRARTALACG